MYIFRERLAHFFSTKQLHCRNIRYFSVSFVEVDLDILNSGRRKISVQAVFDHALLSGGLWPFALLSYGF